ncbi:hypothetical protein Tco_0772146, partial [Tanacetum coccineum]
AVNKISESVKNIEKNFDNALASTSNANDANSIAGKPMDTKTDMKDQTDIMTKFLDEAENMAEIPVFQHLIRQMPSLTATPKQKLIHKQDQVLTMLGRNLQTKLRPLPLR